MLNIAEYKYLKEEQVRESYVRVTMDDTYFHFREEHAIMESRLNLTLIDSTMPFNIISQFTLPFKT
jgi:hypothetical protein